jgi:hypothetical protein
VFGFGTSSPSYPFFFLKRKFRSCCRLTKNLFHQLRPGMYGDIFLSEKTHPLHTRHTTYNMWNCENKFPRWRDSKSLILPEKSFLSSRQNYVFNPPEKSFKFSALRRRQYCMSLVNESEIMLWCMQHFMQISSPNPKTNLPFIPCWVWEQLKFTWVHARFEIFILEFS